MKTSVKKTQYIRQNKNFLDKPMFAVNEIKANKEGHVWQPTDGFRIETDYKLPTKLDQIILYYMMFIAQNNGWQTKLSFSKYELLKGSGSKTGKKEYKRLEDTLERWFRIRIYYENSFVTASKGQTNRVNGAFRIIDSYELNQIDGSSGKTKVYIRLNTEWIDVIRTHAYFHQVNFGVMKAIRSPLGLRLYEILSKNFYGRDTWKIDSLKLARMIPLNVKYASDAVKKICPMITHINKAYGGAEIFTLKISRPVRGAALLTFIKNQEAHPEPDDMPYPGLPASVPIAGKKKIADVPQMELFNEIGEDETKNPEYEKLKNNTDVVKQFLESQNVMVRKRYDRKGFSSPFVQAAWNQFCEQLSQNEEQ